MSGVRQPVFIIPSDRGGRGPAGTAHACTVAFQDNTGIGAANVQQALDYLLAGVADGSLNFSRPSQSGLLGAL